MFKIKTTEKSVDAMFLLKPATDLANDKLPQTDTAIPRLRCLFR